MHSELYDSNEIKQMKITKISEWSFTMIGSAGLSILSINLWRTDAGMYNKSALSIDVLVSQPPVGKK